MRTWAILAVSAVAGHTAVAPAMAQCETVKMRASDGAEGQWFGYRMAISGNIALVGAPRDGVNGVDSGAVYVLRSDGSTWVEEAKLAPSDGAEGAAFGYAVDLEGNVAVISAPGDEEAGQFAGAAYVFRLSDGNWVQEAKLLPDPGSFSSEWGFSLAVSGDVIVVASKRSSSRVLTGSADVFRFDGAQWVNEAVLLTDASASDGYMGLSADVSGDTIVIGAYEEVEREIYASPCVFRYDGANWVREGRLRTAPIEKDDHWFNHTVSISADTVLVGAYWDGGPSLPPGAVYVFSRGKSGWAQEARLTDAIPGSWHMGASVALVCDIAVVGTRLPGKSSGSTGGALVFRRGDTGWGQEGVLVAPTATWADWFGYAVAITDNPPRAVVGAPLDEGNGYQSGAAYFFSLGESYIGDLNCDCVLDGFDVDPFVLAMLGPGHYEPVYPDCDIIRADINGDGSIDGFDIDPFIDLLFG